MKRFFLNIFIFLTPAMVIILLVPVNARFRYEGLKNDCFNHGLWIYDRIHQNEKPVDLALLGTSLILNAADDEYIEQELQKDGYHLAVANFGYCRHGRNLSYILLKELVENKEPAMLLLEVRDNESRKGHPVFPYMARSLDVVGAWPFFNGKWLSDWWIHVVYKMEILQDQLFGEKDTVPVRTRDFRGATSGDTASFMLLEEAANRRMGNEKAAGPLDLFLHETYSRKYHHKIAGLCRKYGIQLIYLYLPVYGSRTFLPAELKTYETYGTVVIPPEKIFKDPSNWLDDSHLNASGARKYSAWLSDLILQYLE